MAECIIARGGGRSDGGGTVGPPIIADKHTILVTLTTSNGAIIPNSSVHCKDGSLWYNYHTNDKGQVLFVTNSGSANITAQNYSINSNCKYADQIPTTNNIDAPIGLSTTLNMSLGWQNSVEFRSMSSDITSSGTACFQGDYKVLAHNRVNVFVGGAGGGGGAGGTQSYTYGYGGGGGGGGAASSNGVVVNSNSLYKFYVGTAGRGASYDSSAAGTAGGTSSAFGIAGNGGGGGSGYRDGSGNGRAGVGTGGQQTWSGGAGGGDEMNGGSSTLGNHGGGGGGGGGQRYSGDDSLSSKIATVGGSPYGGSGGRTWNSPTSGSSASGLGGGGGGGGWDRSGGGGGSGGGGIIKLTFY